ncbi:MAG: hypothetical protein ACKVVP_17625, partial [Chloroflexota bacterium]
ARPRSDQLRARALSIFTWIGHCMTVHETANGRGYTSTYIVLGPGVPGMLFQPTVRNDRASIGVLVMHPFSNDLGHIAGHHLAARGYTVLCANPHTVGTHDSPYLIEDQAPDVALGVAFLRNHSEIRSVVLFGHSAGGPLMSFYQAVAEHGPGICQGPEKIWRCPDSLSDLPAADGIILMDSHGAYGFVTLTYVDPSIVDEQDPTRRDHTLDMYDERNGYLADGARYSPDFVSRFVTAQGERHNRLIAQAEDRWARIQAGQGIYADDEPFLVHGVNSRIWMPDLQIQSRTRGAHPLLHADGSVTTEIVRSVRRPSGNPPGTRSYKSALVGISVRQFLSSHALRTTPDYALGEDFIRGVDWASSSTSTPTNMAHLSVPTIIMPMTGHYFLVTDEIIFEHAGSADKQLVFVDGASHGGTTCHACERTPGEFGDTAQTMFNYLERWLAERFVH